MLYNILFALFLISCIVTIVGVLLQPGKADAGALFTSSVSSTAFGPRGTQTLLAKITIGAAAVFMLSALLMSLPGIAGSGSVIDSAAPDAPVAVPQATPAPNANPANANNGAATDTNGNANTTATPVATTNANAKPAAAAPTASPKK